MRNSNTLRPQQTFWGKYGTYCLLALAVFVVAVSGGVFITTTTQRYTSAPPASIATPTLDPTAQWKPYTNYQLGIAFRHPPSWVIESAARDRKGETFLHRVVALAVPNTHSAYPPTLMFGQVYYYDNPEHLPLHTFEQRRKQLDSSDRLPPVYQPDDEIKTLAHGIVVHYREKGVCESGACQLYIVPIRDKIYVFENHQYQVPGQNERFSQLISTVTFTE
jgi:hypothetical protein